MLSKLSAAWTASPDQRLGQLIENVCFELDPMWHVDLQWNLEDDEFESALDSWLAKHPADSGWKS